MPLNSHWGKGGSVFNLYEKSLKLKNYETFLGEVTIKKFRTFVCDFWVETKILNIKN